MTTSIAGFQIWTVAVFFSDCLSSPCTSSLAGRLSIKVSVTFRVSDTFKVAVFPASTVKEYTVVSTLYPNGADRSFI